MKKNTKSLLAILLACMMIVSCLVVTTPVSATGPVDVWDGTTDTSWYSEGPAEFTLTTAEQLAGFAELVTGGNNFSGKTIKLGVDIQLNSDGDIANFANWGSSAPSLVWTPAGTVTANPFAGTLDGQNHTISGMYIYGLTGTGTSYAAFFACVKPSATIKNLVFDKAYSKNTNNNATSILVAYAEGGGNLTISDVSITNSVVVSGSTGDGAGMFVGKTGSIKFVFTNCFASGTISGGAAIGGIVGNYSSGTKNNHTFTNVDTNLTITASGNQAAGFVALMNSFSNLTITDCDLNNTVTSNEIGGGLIGRIANGSGTTQSGTLTITDTTVAGSVTCTYWGGGFVGCSYVNPQVVNVSGCTVSANVTESSGSASNNGAAGMFGQFPRGSGNTTASMSVSITDSVISGTISGGTAGGVFATLIYAPVTSITVDGLTISGSIRGRTGCCGGIVGYDTKVAAYDIDNTLVSGSITSYGGAAKAAGALIGVTPAATIDVDACGVTGSVSTSSNNGYSGGFVGNITGASTVTFDNCYNTGTFTLGTTANASRVGGFVGSYNPADVSGGVGSFSFNNIYSTMSVKGTDYVGGLIGIINAANVPMSFTNIIMLGKVEDSRATQDGTYNGVLFGSYTTGASYNVTVDGIINVNNVFYEGLALKPKLGRIVAGSGVDPFENCVFWTPGADSTPYAEKQPNDTIQDFLDATNAIDFDTKMGTHTCRPVAIDATTLLLCAVPGCADYRLVDSASEYSTWDEWDGTSADDSWKVLQDDGCYHITNAEQLANLAAEINDDISSNVNFYTGKTIKLDVNIRLNSTSDIANFANWATSAPANVWAGIGSYNSDLSAYHSFDGTFDGQGHTISGIYCVPTGSTHSGTRYALFGAPSENVQIKNLNIDRAYVSGSGNGVGIIAGQMMNNVSNGGGAIYNAFANIKVYNSYLKSTSGDGTGVILGRTAGLVGQILVFDNCDVYDSEIIAPAYAGGLMGFHGSGDLAGLTFKRCDLARNTLRADQNVGGLLGGTYRFSASSPAVVTIRNCTADNRIVITSVTAGNQSGGFIGYLQSPPKSIVIENSSVAGDIDVLQNSGTMIGRIGNGERTENDTKVYSTNANVTISVTNCVSSANLTANVMRDGVNSACLGVVVGLIQTADGTNISSITIDGLTCSGTFDGTLKGGNSMGIIGSLNPVTTTLSVSNVDSTLDLLGVGSGIGGVAGVSGEVLTATFTNVDISGTLTGSDGVAGIVGRSKMFDATFTNCTFTGSAEGTQYVGGLIGDTYTFLDVYEDYSVPANERVFKASLANNIDYSFVNCTVNADLTAATRNVGGIIGDYDPDYGNAAGEHFGSAGALSFTNCVVSGTRTTATNAGGLVGRIYPTNVSVTVDGSTVLGETEATTSGSGAITGCIGTAAGADDLYDIDGFFYSGMSDPKLVPTWNDGGYGVFVECDYFTADEDATPDVVPQSNAAAGAPTAHITNAPAIAETLGGSIREGANPGLRFGFRMDADLRVGEGESVNMGVIMIPASLLGASELTLNTPNVATAKAIRTFGASNPNYIAGSETFTAVLTGIPESKKDVQITARAYVQIGTVVYYSATQTASYNQIAALIP